MRLGEVSDYDFVDALTGFSALGVRLDQFSEHGASGLQIMLEPQHGKYDGAGFGPGQAHNANAATPRWRGDGDDGVVEIHSRIVRELRNRSASRLPTGRAIVLGIDHEVAAHAFPLAFGMQIRLVAQRQMHNASLP
jgi:hypothetical protein